MKQSAPSVARMSGKHNLLFRWQSFASTDKSTRRPTPIFRDENTWITFDCNKAGFSQAMKESGFNVVYCGNTDHIEKPMLRIAVFFPSLLEENYIDSCVLSCYGINQFPRVLWTAKGMEEMVLCLKLNPAISKYPQDEDGIMFLFNQLRGIKRVVVKGSRKYAESLPKEVTRPYKDAADIGVDLDLCIDQFKIYKEGSRWREAATYCESTIAFLADCYKVYGCRFIEDNDVVFGMIKRWTVQVAMDLAEAKVQLSDYELALKYAKYALRISPVPTPNTFRLRLLHGQAYTGLKQESKAMTALLKAQALRPTDSTVIQALGVLKKSLDIDPNEALTKFKELRISTFKNRDADKKTELEKIQECLTGNVVVRVHTSTEDGLTHILDLRNGGHEVYKFAANDRDAYDECFARLRSANADPAPFPA